jgi:hypothetical protein
MIKIGLVNKVLSFSNEIDASAKKRGEIHTSEQKDKQTSKQTNNEAFPPSILTIFSIIHAAKDNDPYDRSHNHQGAQDILPSDVCAHQDLGEDEVVDQCHTT